MKTHVIFFLCLVLFIGCVPEKAHLALRESCMQLYEENRSLNKIIEEQDKGKCKARSAYLQHKIDLLKHENEVLKLKLKILESIEK